MTTLTLHKLPEGFIITSDEEIVSGDIVLVNNEYHNNLLRIFTTVFGGKKEDCKKVIAQQDQIDFSSLSEEEQKEIGWYDIYKLFQEDSFDVAGDWSSALKTYKAGFQKAQELLSDRRFTLEDINNAYDAGMKFIGEDKGSPIEFIQSLTQPKSWKVECIEENGKVKIIKLL